MNARIPFIAAGALIAALSMAGAANAAVAVSASPSKTYAQDVASTPDSQVVWDFDGIAASGFSLAYAGGASEANGTSGTAAAPPGDTTDYAAVRKNSTITLMSLKLLSSISIFMGSPDSYNFIRFVGPGLNQTLNGVQLAGGIDFGGDRTVGKRVTYSFGDTAVNQVIFGSTGHSFEFDRIAATMAAIPEPGAWALMLTGFGAMGAILRRRRAHARVAFA
jgi:hypothetical protein